MDFWYEIYDLSKLKKYHPASLQVVPHIDWLYGGENRIQGECFLSGKYVVFQVLYTSYHHFLTSFAL